MIIPFKNRVIDKDKPVHVYRNLNAKWRCFSIQQNNLVVAHADGFIIKNVKARVSESGRQRVIKEKQKNVHAKLIGEFVGEKDIDVSNLDEIFYDPYTTESFINKTTGEPIYEIRETYFKNGKAYILTL